MKVPILAGGCATSISTLATWLSDGSVASDFWWSPRGAFSVVSSCSSSTGTYGFLDCVTRLFRSLVDSGYMLCDTLGLDVLLTFST